MIKFFIRINKIILSIFWQIGSCIPCSIFLLLSIIIFSIPIQIMADEVTSKDEVAPKYEKGSKRDPFIPIVTNDGQLINIKDEDGETQLYLEGIIFDKDGNSMAIINGQILKKNDSIKDLQIVEVRKDSVVYIKDGEIFILNLKGEE